MARLRLLDGVLAHAQDADLFLQFVEAHVEIVHGKACQLAIAGIVGDRQIAGCQGVERTHDRGKAGIVAADAILEIEPVVDPRRDMRVDKVALVVEGRRVLIDRADEVDRLAERRRRRSGRR